MSEQELLRLCRYYRGGGINPFYDELERHEIDKSNLPPPECMRDEYDLSNEVVMELSEKGEFCMRENQWVDMMQKPENETLFAEMVEEYRQYMGGFAIDDDTPMTLKALLHNRWVHWGGTDATFRDHYRKYIKTAIHG